jgi:2-dehydropantoate 2-reductase
MRVLVLGAGAVGGYFGARLIEAGTKVTFLVRQRRAGQIARSGIVVESHFGNFSVRPNYTTEATGSDWDLVIVACKAYDLASAIAAIAPAVGPETVVLPLLNGIAHIDEFDERFGSVRTVAGVAYIAATLTPDGVIHHLNNVHRIGFGGRHGRHPPALTALAEALRGSPVDFRLLENPIQSLWDKLALLGPLAAMTSLMRAPVGRIVATEGGALMMRTCLAEVIAIAEAAGHGPSATVVASTEKVLTEPGSRFAASMLRDIERHGPTEGEHIVGDLAARARAAGIDAPLLQLAWRHLQAYEAGRTAPH